MADTTRRHYAQALLPGAGHALLCRLSLRCQTYCTRPRRMYSARLNMAQCLRRADLVCLFHSSARGMAGCETQRTTARSGRSLLSGTGIACELHQGPPRAEQKHPANNLSTRGCHGLRLSSSPRSWSFTTSQASTRGDEVCAFWRP